MKAELIGNYNGMRCRGSSILEVLIATSVLTLGIAASTLLSFANQSIKLDSDTAGEALYKAKDTIESTRALSRQDFNGVVSSATSSDGIYSQKLDVLDVTSCRKEATSRITWSTETTRPQRIKLTTDVTNVASTLALGGDCDTDPPTGGWTNPGTLGSEDVTPAGQQATDIDVMNKIVFLTAEMPDPAHSDFFIFDATNGVSPVILSSIHTGPGLNAVDVARDQSTGKITAYVANNNVSQQLQIIDATNFASPTLVSSANLEPAPLGANSEGRSIFYYDEKIYIGTNYLPSFGPPRPEFHIFNVADPALPVELGSYDVNHNINKIIVRDDYAYLATSDNDREVWILDISNPASPTFVSTFNATGDEDGDSIYLVGNTLYLGRDHAPSSRPDFYILDVTNPASISVLGSTNLSMNPSIAEVNDIHVSGDLAFLATGDANDEFQVLNISNPTSITLISTFDFPQDATGVDFENNLIYASVRSNDALHIIRPAECADKIDDDGDGNIDSDDPQCHTDNNVNNAASYDPEDDDESN